MLRTILFLIFTFIFYNTSYPTTNPMGVSVITSPQGEKIFFEPKSQSGIAFFHRKDKWILVFDTDDVLNLNSFSMSQIIGDIEIIPANKTIVQFTIKKEYFPRISPYKTGWVIDFQTNTEEPCRDIPREKQNNQYILKTPMLSDKVSFSDPISGDNLFAFPSKNSQECIKDDRNYMNFSLFKTLQGVVVHPKTDQLAIKYADSQLSLNIPEQLTSSKEDMDLYAQNPESMGIEFTTDRIITAPFYARKQYFIEKIASGLPEARMKYRLDFSRFLIAFALGEEAANYLESLQKEDTILDKSPTFLILSGLASLLSQNFDGAKKYFSNDLVKEYGDIPFYLNLTEALRKKPFKKHELYGFKRLSPYLPTPLKIHLGLKTLEVSAQHNLFEVIRETIRVLSRESIQESDQDLISYYQALLYESDGSKAESDQTLEKLASSSHPKVYTLVRMRMLTKDLSTKESRLKAAQELEKLRFCLTGGDIEIQILEKIADIHLTNQDWIKTLRSWSKILQYHPNYFQKDALIKKVGALFIEKYTPKFMESSPIFIVLGLFDEFSSLIDSLSDENKIVLKLSDVAKKSHLHQKTFTLLEKQAKKNPDNTLPKMSLLLKLAQAQSNLKKNRDVLTTIGNINREILTPPERDQLDFLKVYTLYTLGELTLNHDNILPDNNSYEAHHFRARVYWSLKDWKKASDSLKKVLILSPPEAIFTQYHIIYYAIAVRYSGDYVLLKELRDYYLSQLKGSPLQQLFDLVTTLDTVMDKLNIPDLKDALMEIKTLEKFMEEYKKQARK